MNASNLHPRLPHNTLDSVHRHLEAWLENGAQYVSLPWVASDTFAHCTKPDHVVERQGQSQNGLFLVASGEQVFLELAASNQLNEDVTYVGWTPCFRQEPHWDASHHHYFLKAEAYRRISSSCGFSELMSMIQSAKNVFASLMDEKLHPFLSIVKIETDHEQWDIVLGETEIGSYGIRKHPMNEAHYIYATVCAEPRLSYAKHTLQSALASGFL